MNREIRAINKTGLLYQFIGTIILSFGLAFTSDDDLRMLSATRWAFNNNLFNSLVTQRIDIRYGLAILLLGVLIAFFDSQLSKIKAMNEINRLGISSPLSAILLLCVASYVFDHYGYNVSISEIVSGGFFVIILVHMIFYEGKNRK